MGRVGGYYRPWSLRLLLDKLIETVVKNMISVYLDTSEIGGEGEEKKKGGFPWIQECLIKLLQFLKGVNDHEI